jgi:hypothetical protein
VKCIIYRPIEILERHASVKMSVLLTAVRRTTYVLVIVTLLTSKVLVDSVFNAYKVCLRLFSGMQANWMK